MPSPTELAVVADNPAEEQTETTAVATPEQTPDAPAAEAPKKIAKYFDSEEHVEKTFDMLFSKAQQQEAAIQQRDALLNDPAVRAVIESRRQAAQQPQVDPLEMQTELAIRQAVSSGRINEALQLKDGLTQYRMRKHYEAVIPATVQRMLDAREAPNATYRGILNDQTVTDLHDAAPELSYLHTKYGIPQDELVAIARRMVGVGEKRGTANRQIKDSYIEGTDGTLMPSYKNMTDSQWDKHVKDHWNSVF